MSRRSSSNSKSNQPFSTRRHPPRHVRRRRDRSLCDELETRILFNILSLDTDPLTATPENLTFEYKDARGQNVRISMQGDITAEFVFAKVGKDGTVLLRDAVSTTKIG